MIIHTFEQHSEDWYNMRLGKFTASHAATIATAGKGLETLCYDLVAEILTKHRKDTFQSPAMEQGNLLEDQARTLYELETGNTVEQVGFVEVDEYSGCSPDGLILNRTSGIEIKCPQDNTYAKYLYDGIIKPEYFAQMQMQMLFMQANVWDYVVFNPHFDTQIIIKKVPADVDFQNKIITGVDKGKNMVQKILAQINNNYPLLDNTDDFLTDFTLTKPLGI